MINWEEEKKKAKSLDTKDKYNRLIYSAGENNKNSVDELYRLTNPAQAAKWQDYNGVGTDRLKEKLYNHAADVEFENYLASNNIDADKLAAQSSAIKLRSSLNDVTDTYNSVRDGKTLSEKEAKQYQKAVKNARELYNANKGIFSEKEISQIDNSFNALDALSDEYANYYSIYENTDAYKDLPDKSKEKYWKEQKKKAKKELRQAKLNDFENILAETAASNPIVSDEFKSQLIENKKQSGREIDAKRDAYYNIKARENYYNTQDVMERVNIIDTNNDLKMLVDGIYNANKSIETAENSTLQSYDNNAQNLNDPYQNELNKTILSSQQIVESNTKKINDLGYNADELIEAYTAYKDGLAADEQEQQITDFAKSHPYLATFASWGITAAMTPGSLSRYVDTAVETATGNSKKQVVFEDGQAVSVETGVQSPATQARDTLRSGVSDLISKSSSGKLGQITYDIVNSGVDSAINMAVGSITGTGITEIMNTGKNAAEIAKNTKNIVSATTSLIMGSQVGAEKMVEAKQNGDSDIQALALGALYATATIVSEKYSLDEILKSTDKSWIKSLAKGAVAEGSEEIVENILDRIADVAVEGNDAEIFQQYYTYLQNGYSSAEATGKVFVDMLGEDALAFVGGAVSGAVMKGIGSMAVPNQYEAIGNDVKSYNQVQQEINTGLAMPEGSKAYKLAVELQDTLNSKSPGENATENVEYNNLSSKKIGKLSYYNTLETEKGRFNDAVYHDNNAQALQKSFEKLINAKNVTSKDVRNFANSEEALDYINDSYGTNYNSKNISVYSLNELARAFEADALVGAPKIRFGKLVDKNYNSLSLNTTDSNGNNVTIESVEYASPKGSTITFNTTDGNVLANDEINFTPAQSAVVNEISQAKVGKNGVATIMSYAPENTNVDEAQIYSNNAVALYNVSKTSDDTIDTLLKNKTVAGIAEYLVERTENENAARDIIASAREDLMQRAATAYAEQKSTENIKSTGTELSEQLNKAVSSKRRGVHYVGDVQKRLSKKQKNQLSIFSKLVQGNGTTAANIVIADKSTANVVDKNGNAVVANALQTGKSIVLFADAETDMLMAYGGHELTHYLEKFADAKLYTNYHNFVMDYLHSKWNENTYNANVNEYARAYGFDKDTEMYQIEREMVADNGMAVFSDEEALKTLAGENRTLLQKILDFFNEFIGRLDNALRGLAKTSVVYNEVKADRQFLLESAKQIKAMLDSVENNTAKQSDTTQFSIRTIVDENGKNYGKGVYLDSNILDGLDETARKAKIAQYINEMGGQGFYATDRNGKPVLIEIPTSKKFKNNSGKMKKANGDLIRKNNNSIVKLQAMSLIDETIQLSKYDNQSPPKYPHGWLDNKGKTKWEYYTVIVQEKNKTIWSATLNVTTTANGNKILYDIMPIKKVEPGVKSPATTINSISQSQNDVNTKFSLKTSVEEAKELVAIHNTTETKLIKSLELGGLPMPSIAVMKAQNAGANSAYGDISLVFDKSVIDPKANRKNKVYGSDAWTPTYPAIEFKASEKVADKIHNLYYDFARKYGYNEAKPLYNVANDLENELNRRGGEAGLIDYYKDDTNLMNFYLIESGKSKIQPITKEIRTEMSKGDIELSQYFVNALGEDVINELKVDNGESIMARRRKYFEKYGDKIAETYAKYFADDLDISIEEGRDIVSQTTMGDYLRMINNAYNYLQGNIVSINTEKDRAATDEAIKKAVGNGYVKWLNDLFKGSEEKSGIRNNVDYFTPMGNRRSFEALHWENNLENVVNAMREDITTGNASMFSGLGIWGVSAKDYNSIEAIKSDSSRLSRMNEEEYSKIKQNFGERLHEIATAIMDKTERNQFIAIDNAEENIVDAVRNSKTKSGILNNLKQYQQLNVTEATVDDIVSLVTDISNMPTEYFEAKPQRAVYFNEVYKAVIPDNSSEKLKTELSNAGVDYAEYKAGNEQSRLDVLNSMESIKFSKNTSIDDFDVKRYNDVWISDKSEYAAVMSAIKMSDLNDTPHFEIRKINTYGKSYLYYYDVDDNPHIVSEKTNGNYGRIYNEINGTSDELLESIENDGSRYRNSKRSYELSDGRRTAKSNDGLANRKIQTENSDNGTGYTEDDRDVNLREENNNYSRNTYTRATVGLEDSNEILEQGLKMLAGINNIDFNSNIVDLVGKANANLNKQGMADFKASKMYNKNSVNDIAKQLKSEYASTARTGYIRQMLTDLYDYMANSTEPDLDYMNSQAKVIARELISTSTHVVESDYNELHDYVGAKPFSVSEEIKQSFAKEYGSWSEAKTAVIPNLKVRNNAISLSQYYNDLAKEFSGISAGEFSNVFDESVVDEREMLERLGAFYYATQPTVTNNFQEQIESNGSIDGKYTLDEFENIVANDIFDKFFNVEQVANAIDTLAQEQKNAIDEIKDKFESEKHALIERYKQRELNLKEHNKLVNQRARERRNATGIRAKIVKIKNDFDKMLNHPTQSRHIPRALVQEVAQICDVITDSQYYNKNGRERSQNVIITLDRLKTKYDSIKNDSDYIVENAYDSNIADYITQLADRLNGKQLSDMTSAELQEVYEVLRAIQKAVSNANKLIKSQVKLDAHKAAVEFMLENNKTKGRRLADKEKGINVRGGINGAVSAFDSDFMNPMRYVNLMVEGNHNSVLYGLFDDLNRGARAKDKYIMEFSKPFDALIADKRYKSYKEKKVDTGINVNGMPVMLTEDQIAQILLTAQRKQGVTHLQGGGFVALNTNYMQKGNMAKAKINGTVVPALQIDTINYFASLYNSLSDYGKKWVDSAKYFFTTQSKPIINETSFELKGYKIAGEDNYIPIAVDKNYTNQEIEGVILDKTLENSGFTKSTVPNASNRIIISGLSNVISKHINDVAKYAGLAIPIHNFNKVWKGQTSSVYDRQAISELGGHRLSVRDAVQRKWGDQAVRVIEKTVKDLQTERISEISEIDRLYNKLLSGSINAVFTGNISIVLKQAASYPTAVAVLDSDCLAKGIKGFAQTESLYSEIDQHTATHYKRRLGLSTQELGELAKVKRNQGKQFSKLSPTKWIQLMDVQTTAALWLACKAQVVKDNKGIDINSVQYWAKVTELYDYVVETTQPNYDIMHRPEIQKSNGAISKTLSLFQTQPLQNAGILYDSIRNLNWKKEALKNDSNTKTLAEYKQAQGQAVKAIWSQVSSAMVFSAMSTFVRFLLHNLKKYRDEDDEVKAKKVLEVWTSEAVQTLLGVAMPVIGSISYDIGNRLLTLVQTGKATTQFDFIQNMGMSAINDFLGDAYNVFKSSVNVAQGVSDAKDLANDIYVLSGDVASFFGIPVKNVENILKSAWAYGNEAFSSDYRLFEYGVDTTKSQYISRAYKAIENGDKQAYQNAYNKLIQNGYTDNEIHSGIKSELIKNNSQIAQAGVLYLDGEIDNMFDIVEQLKMAGYDERDIIQAIKGYKNKIVEAKNALVDGDQEEYESKLNELMQSGIDKDTIVNAINSVEVEEENSATVKQIYSTDDVIAAINDGDTKHSKSMIDSMVQIAVDNGKDENSAKKDIKSKIAAAYKTDYVTATAAERKSIEKELNASGLFENSDYKEWVANAYDSDGIYGDEAMKRALEGGQQSAQKYINARVIAKVNIGQDEETVKRNIKAKIAAMYKNDFINGIADTRASILTIMTNTGLYGSRKDAQDYTDENWLK